MNRRNKEIGGTDGTVVKYGGQHLLSPGTVKASSPERLGL